MQAGERRGGDAGARHGRSECAGRAGEFDGYEWLPVMEGGWDFGDRVFADRPMCVRRFSARACG